VRAIDTNILVRIATNDDPDQVARARQALESGEALLCLSVCLEAEWVLRAGYKLSPTTVADILTRFAGAEGITVERPDLLAAAIAWHLEGMDFADALHLAVATDLGCTSMLSFDNHYTKSAARLGTIPVHQP
jgi:predicted nucleic-acid-binding protein